jgi:C-terminal processing protease CtpA/Prc
MIKYLLIAGVCLYGYASNSLGRIGIQWCPATHIITRVYEGSPAAQAGLQPGDKIISVDDKPSNHQDIEGQPDTICRLHIYRLLKPGIPTEFEVSMIRVRAETIDYQHYRH